ncbi:MAG: DUF6691 family protein [Usitatibacter sp.]
MTRPQALETLASFATGMLFAAGLIVSGMVNPAKVQGFLDLFGRWDPSLALVMAAAVGVGFVGFAWTSERAQSALGLPMRISSNRSIDRRLIFGATVFGVGWGLAGFCPGPAVVALASGSSKAIVFAVSMLAGMALFEWMESRREERSVDSPGSPRLG